MVLVLVVVVVVVVFLNCNGKSRKHRGGMCRNGVPQRHIKCIACVLSSIANCKHKINRQSDIDSRTWTLKRVCVCGDQPGLEQQFIKHWHSTDQSLGPLVSTCSLEWPLLSPCLCLCLCLSCRRRRRRQQQQQHLRRLPMLRHSHAPTSCTS